MVVVFFLQEDILEDQHNSINEELKNSPQVLEMAYINSENALEKFKEKFPELQEIVESLKINPFPSSFEVTLKEKILSSDKSFEFIENIKNMPGIEDTQYNKDWVEKMQSFSRLAKAIGLFLGGILGLTSFFIISNVIKLNVFARKDEIEILRLTGGTNMFIRMPFLFEGILLGILGGILSLALLFIVINIFPLYMGTSLGVLNELINFRHLSVLQGLMLIVSGGIIGLFGSFSSLTRFLKT